MDAFGNSVDSIPTFWSVHCSGGSVRFSQLTTRGVATENPSSILTKRNRIFCVVKYNEPFRSGLLCAALGKSQQVRSLAS